MTKVVQTVDNFDKTVPAVDTLTWVWRGVAYTMDLGEQNLAQADADFGRYAAAADRIGPATITVITSDGEELVFKPRGKPAKLPKAKRTDATSLHDATQSPTPVAEPAAPFADEFPPNKAWLRSAGDRSGPGSHERATRGRKYRNDARIWLQTHGWDSLGNRGVIPQAGLDEYWEYVERTRAARAGSA